MPNPSKANFKLDLRELEVRLVRYKIYHNKTYAFIADYLNISEVSLNYKLRGQIPFSVREIILLKRLLGLSSEEVGELFFTVLEDKDSA